MFSTELGSFGILGFIFLLFERLDPLILVLMVLRLFHFSLIFVHFLLGYLVHTYSLVFFFSFLLMKIIIVIFVIILSIFNKFCFFPVEPCYISDCFLDILKSFTSSSSSYSSSSTVIRCCSLLCTGPDISALRLQVVKF